MESNISNTNERKPKRPAWKLEAYTEAVDNLCTTIYVIDIAIKVLAKQLERAQPHRAGRVAVMFGKNTGIRLKGNFEYDVEPILGKMIPMQSGDWRFMKLTKKDRYDTLSELRVGKSLPSDSFVVYLIDGIEHLLARRDYIESLLIPLRAGVPGKIKSIQAECLAMSHKAIGRGEKLEIDWTLGAAQAENALIERNRKKYEAKKTKAKALAASQAEMDLL